MEIAKPIHVRILNIKTKQPIPLLMGTLTVYAKKKNNYDIEGFTDRNGLITYSPDLLAAEINTIQSLFMTDYLSILSECRQFVTLKIPRFTPAIRAEKIDFLNNYWEYLWKPEEKQTCIRRAQNDRVIERSIAFHVNPTEETAITLPVKML